MESVKWPKGSGELNQRIVIRRWQDVPNDAFGLDQDFDTGVICWAKHEPVHGLTLRAGMQTSEAPTDLFYVRIFTGTTQENLSAEHIIEFRGWRYRVIDTVIDGIRRRYIRIATKNLGAIAS